MKETPATIHQPAYAALSTTNRRHSNHPRRTAVLAFILGTIGCASPRLEDPPLITHEPPRPCGSMVEYVVDTTVDFQAPNVTPPVLLTMSIPEIPAELRRGWVANKVLVSFALDSSGRVVPGTVSIDAESNRAFGNSVCRWILEQRFQPLRIDGKAYSVRVPKFPIEHGSIR